MTQPWNVLCFTVCVLASSLASGYEEPIMNDFRFPDGHRVALYLDCGGEQTTATNGGLELRLLSGVGHAFPNVPGPAGTAFYDSRQVVFELDGLNPNKAYVLGFTWWDADDSGRTQSVQFSATEDGGWQTVLPAIRASAYNADQSTWARVLLPLTAAYSGRETLRAAFVNESGPNAVVNEIWLLEQEQPAREKRILIVTGDDYAGHDWRTTSEAFAALLREDARFEVSVTESPAIYGSPLLDHYDATVLHFKDYADRLPLGAAIHEGLQRYVDSGRGLVLSHFACGAFQEWDGFVRIAGRVWNPALRGHDPHGVFTVRITDSDHPVTADMAGFEILDELYTCLDGDTPIRLLAEATSLVDSKAYPMAFTVENTGGPVFHCVLGHDVRAYEAPGARALYRKGVAWAAGLE